MIGNEACHKTKEKRMNATSQDTIKSILMRRDGLSAKEADSQIQEVKRILNERLANGEMPFDLCEEEFGLEPDYLEQLI